MTKWITRSKLLGFLAGGYNPIKCGEASLAYALQGIDFNDHVNKNTDLQDYQAQAGMPWSNGQLPDIDGIIERAIDDCISISYDPRDSSCLWPLTFNFSVSDDWKCIQFQMIVSDLQNSVIELLDDLYAPSSNTGNGRYVT